LLRAGAVGFLASMLIAFLIPKSYTSTTQLMPPDSQSSSGLAMMAALAGKASAGLPSMAGDLLGLKSSGALFIGVLRSQTAQEHIIEQFDLRRVYGKRLITDARKKLDENTEIAEDRKSGIIAISVTDHNAQRAAAIANAYVDELNSLVVGLSTSAAHRERVFLEGRLRVAKQDLDSASNALAEFSSKNGTLDMQNEGKAMLDAASSIAGQLIAAQAQLEGLRQIYTDNNARVRAFSGRVAELRKQLEKLGGQPETEQGNAAQSVPATPTGDPLPEKGTGMPFPTIRNLPLLGAKYADYYRNAKIQETVYEMLTQQYELAKVQEAKETPSVKVLDPARVAEKKSFPPRMMFISLGTLLAFLAAMIWIFAVRSWELVGADDQRKALVLEVAATLRANAPWTSQGPDGEQSSVKRIWRLLGGGQPPSDGPLVP
jgi:capsule polysaccharide export protein KpsE/RkpR